MQEIRFRNRKELQEYIDNPNNYRQARYKTYYNWCSMPQLDTNVYNIVRETYEETHTGAPFVLYDVVGDCSVLSESALRNNWVFENDLPITTRYIQDKIRGGVIDWFKIKAKPTQVPVYALFIPSEYDFTLRSATAQKFVTGNKSGVRYHGLGDFIIAAAVKSGNGYRPNLSKRDVVLGDAFVRMFNNQGWGDCISAPTYDLMMEQPKMKIVQYKGIQGSVKA